MNERALDAIVKQVNKRYGEGSISRASDHRRVHVLRVPTGIFGYDCALGGGTPRGRIMTIRGPYSAGKTWLALKSAAGFQHTCRNCNGDIGGDASDSCRCKSPAPGVVGWLDAEGVYDNKWAAKQGIRNEDVYLIQTEYAEQAIDTADALLRSGELDCLVVDSVAALTPATEIEETTEKWQMGLQARLINKAMRKWISSINSVGNTKALTVPTIILINQTRLKIGIVYGSSETMPGGEGQKFASSIEVSLKKGEWLHLPEDKEHWVGQQIQFTISKNKTAPPWRAGDFKMWFADVPQMDIKAGYVDNLEGISRLGLYWGVIKQDGAYYTLPGKKSSLHGLGELCKVLAEDEGMREKVKKEILDKEYAWAGREIEAPDK